MLATLGDYALARSLLLAPIHSAIGIGKKFKKAEKLAAEITATTFTTKEVAEVMGYKSKMGPHHLLKDLMKAELVTCTNPAARQEPGDLRVG